ncbi:MAG: hypothetical protein K1X78_15630 [Verrucomicrobiaceae bacterium]|nr:hypothetical protein [Verrucomicrobiaceae bacterium]
METLVLELTEAQDRRLKSLASSAGVSVRDLVISKLLGAEQDETAYLLSSKAMEKRLLEAMNEPADRHLTFNTTEDAAHALGV